MPNTRKPGPTVIDYTTGPGTWLEYILNAVGYTKLRHVRLKRWLGLMPACGCTERKRALNRMWHHWKNKLRAWQRGA